MKSRKTPICPALDEEDPELGEGRAGHRSGWADTAQAGRDTAQPGRTPLSPGGTPLNPRDVVVGREWRITYDVKTRFILRIDLNGTFFQSAPSSPMRMTLRGSDRCASREYSHGRNE